MAYASTEDLQLRLSDLFRELYVSMDGNPMDEEAAAGLAAAEAEINSVIGVRYVTPVTASDAQPLLKLWTVTLAEELAWSRSGKSELPKNLADRAAHVRASLDRIAAGGMVLPGAAQDELNGNGSFVTVEGDPPVFSRVKMGGY